jgi:hypothetical protein
MPWEPGCWHHSALRVMHHIDAERGTPSPHWDISDVWVESHIFCWWDHWLDHSAMWFESCIICWCKSMFLPPHFWQGLWHRTPVQHTSWWCVSLLDHCTSCLGSRGCITASSRSQGEFVETWCFISPMFISDHLGFIAPTCIPTCPTCKLGSFIAHLGKSKSVPLSQGFIDEVLHLFSVLTFAFECSQITVPSWHGFTLSERREHSPLRGHVGAEGMAIWGPSRG